MNFYDGHSQNAPVTWKFNAERVTNSEWIISFSASLPPGWHIYSQYLAEGGPVPTTIRLIQSDDYIQVGKAFEQGEPICLYDSIYEMQLTWYTQRVTFLQKVRLKQVVPQLKGTIDYMVCNDHLCIPHQEEFTISLQTPDKSH